MNFDDTINREIQKSRLMYDRLLYGILMLHIPVAILLIPIGYDTRGFATIASLLVGVAATAAYFAFRGTRLFGIIAGMLLMTFSAIFIQAQMGRIEMHFHIFSALALMLVYRDWATVVAPAAVIAVHHLSMTALQLNEAQLGGMPLVVFNYGCNWTIAFIHAAFVVFESAILIYFSLIMRREQVSGMQLVAAVSEVQDACDLSIRVPEDSQNPIARAFNSMLTDFDNLINDIRGTSGQMAAMATDLLDFSNNTSSDISTQHEQVDHASHAMAEMSDAIQQVAGNAQQAATAAQEADGQAKKGAGVVTEAVQITSRLTASMNQTNDSIDLLKQNADSIGSVVDVIRGISEQTNLLALNAAIEAARAGEQGRGFAVVADEVRTLAQRTQQSTEEIQGIIESLQIVTEQVVENITVGRENSNQTADKISMAGDVLNTIVHSVTRIMDMNTQIAATSEEQSRTADSILSNIQQVSDISKTTVGRVEKNLTAAGELQSLSGKLDRHVGKYRTG